MDVMFNLLTSPNHEWTNSDKLLSVLKPPLMRLCARYINITSKIGDDRSVMKQLQVNTV